jgi:glycosyltransferase involved in cell wall biosynthesis
MNPAMRVLHVITELRLAGAERAMFELVSRLDRRGFEPRVVAMRGGVVADWLAQAGVDVTVLNLRGKWDIARLMPLRRIVAQWRPDVIHTHLFHGDLAARLATAGLKHRPPIIHTVQTTEGRFRPWHSWPMRIGSRRYAKIVAVSQSVRQSHQAATRLSGQRYEVIPNGADTQRLSPDSADRERVRREWGAEAGTGVAAFVGRLSPEKGIETLIEAWPRVRPPGEALLVIAGDGPLRARVQAFANSRADVKYLGFIDDVAGVYRGGDLLVMPSRWEGLPLSAAEAMACQLPVVGCDVPGLRDVVEAGRTGILVARDQPEALAEAVQKLLGDATLRQTLGQAGRQRVERHFNVTETARSYERLYEAAAESGRTGTAAVG